MKLFSLTPYRVLLGFLHSNTRTKISNRKLDVVGHICNHSYSGGSDRRIATATQEAAVEGLQVQGQHGQGQQDPISKKK
jgi:hypothetical protein